MIAKGRTIFQRMMIILSLAFHRVYKCGTNSNEQFANATERTIDSLFRKASVLERLINYTREEVLIALSNTKTTVPVSMSQEIHLPDEQVIDDTDIFDVFHDGNDTTTLAYVDGDGIDDDDILVESTTGQTDCIDFGLCALPLEDVLNCHHYNAYNMIMPRAK